MTYRLIHRRSPEGPTPPAAVSIASPRLAAFVGPSDERIEPNGIIEWARRFRVGLPASEKPGHGQAALRVDFGDGNASELPLVWDVLPSLWAVPSGLVIRSDDRSAERSVLVRSAEIPFKILDVAGATVDDQDGKIGEVDPALQVRLKLRLDGSKLEGGVATVRIGTDHPGYPHLDLTVIVTR